MMHHVEADLHSASAGDPTFSERTDLARRSRAPWFAIVSLVVFGALVVGRILTGGGAAEPVETPVVIDDGAGPAEVVNPLAPDDGTESIMLPVWAEPAENLFDGEQIQVFAEEFPPFAEVALVQCSPHAGVNPGVDRCMISTFERAVASPDGDVVATFTVQRMLVIGDQEIDCTSPPPDGFEASCVVAVGMLSDYDVSGTAPLHFDPAAPITDHPSVELSARIDVHDYQQVTLTIRNPGAGSRWHVNQCVVRANPAHCGGGAVVDPQDPELQGAVFSPDGADIVATVPLRRMVDDVDCAREPEACSLVVQRQDDMRIYSTRLSFVPGAPLAQAALVVDADPPLVAGSPVPIEIVNRAPGQLTHPVMQCAAGSVDVDSCVPVGRVFVLVATGGRGEVTPVARVDAAGASTDCSTDGACVLRIYDPDGTAAAEVPVVARP
jgi:hypothetical protein